MWATTAFSAAHATTYLEPDPLPDSTTFGQTAFQTSTITGTVVLSQPVDGLILHVVSLDGSQLTVSGTSTTGDSITLVPLVKNNEMEITGKTLNATPPPTGPRCSPVRS